jgi:peptide methionine sulfoxide reductase MsrA
MKDIEPLSETTFYKAEEYHQYYFNKNMGIGRGY